jgi:hypothetical protein
MIIQPIFILRQQKKLLPIKRTHMFPALYFQSFSQASPERPSKTKPVTCVTGFYVVGDDGLASLSRFWGPYNIKSVALPLASLSGFVFSVLFQASPERPSKTKPVTCVTGFYVVGDDGFEPPTLCL